MERKVHTWIAIRAVALLADTGEVPELVSLLKPRISSAIIGAWLPDKPATKRAHGITENHIFKMKPLQNDDPQAARFTTTLKVLSSRLGNERSITGFLNSDKVLDSNWWSCPYKSDAPPGRHIPNCAMGMRLTLCDILAMADTELQGLTHRSSKELQNADPKVLTAPDQAALYFMMLSHFIADASMPFHCDARPLASYGKGLHEKLEEHWAQGVNPIFGDDLRQAGKSPDQLLDTARKAYSNISFPGRIPVIRDGRDVWTEMVDVCRGSFALASIIVPRDEVDYGSDTTKEFDEVFDRNTRPGFLDKVTEVALHDAVLNTAMVWKDIWLDFTKP
jgi:hypothetical protein